MVEDVNLARGFVRRNPAMTPNSPVPRSLRRTQLRTRKSNIPAYG